MLTCLPMLFFFLQIYNKRERERERERESVLYILSIRFLTFFFFCQFSYLFFFDFTCFITNLFFFHLSWPSLCLKGICALLRATANADSAWTSGVVGRTTWTSARECCVGPDIANALCAATISSSASGVAAASGTVRKSFCAPVAIAAQYAPW